MWSRARGVAWAAPLKVNLFFSFAATWGWLWLHLIVLILKKNQSGGVFNLESLSKTILDEVSQAILIDLEKLTNSHEKKKNNNNNKNKNKEIIFKTKKNPYYICFFLFYPLITTSEIGMNYCRWEDTKLMRIKKTQKKQKCKNLILFYLKKFSCMTSISACSYQLSLVELISKLREFCHT